MPSSIHMNPGQMETTSVRCLINSISRFILLVSCQTQKPISTLMGYKSIIGPLKLLKQALDDVVDCKLPSDESLIKDCEELDVAVNEAREFLENWSPKMSKLCSVLWSEPLLIKIQNISLRISQSLHEISQSSESTSNPVVIQLQSCRRELQCLKPERLPSYIDEALRSLRDKTVPDIEHLICITKLLGLTSSQEILKESVAIEKERMKAQVFKTKGELDQINQVVVLLSNIRDSLIKIDCFQTINGIRILPYFRCPLSLELMLDPVILASGQTFERASIQKWLDEGLNICPKTRQILSHTNLIPNYTVKAMIENWCKDKPIKLSEASERTNAILLPSLSTGMSPPDLLHMDSFPLSLQSDSTSRSSLEVGNVVEQHKLAASIRSCEDEFRLCHIKDTEKFEPRSNERSYVHSRSESVSSEISSISYVPAVSTEVSGIVNKHGNNEFSGEITSEYPASLLCSRESVLAPLLEGKKFSSSKEMTSKGNINCSRLLSLPLSGKGTDDLTTTSDVEKLVEDLKSPSSEVQTMAAAELRLLTKQNSENRVIVGHCGAIPSLVSLLYSPVEQTQEHAVTALLNLSLNENNKCLIAESGVIEPLIHVLKSGNAAAKENSAATLFSLSVLEEYKAKIGRSGAIKPLVDLLGSGTLRGKKDAATALFNLSIFHDNKARIVKAGAVKYLIELMESTTGMVDKSIALLSNLSTISEGRLAIVREGGLQSVVEVVEAGSQRGKENGASILLQLCLDSPKFCTLVLQEGAVPPLVALSQSGTPRAKEKAQQLLSHFRSQREGNNKKGKS